MLHHVIGSVYYVLRNSLPREYQSNYVLLEGFLKIARGFRAAGRRRRRRLSRPAGLYSRDVKTKIKRDKRARGIHVE